MRTTGEGGEHASPMRLLGMLSDRFGAFETIAFASHQISRTGGHENAPPRPDQPFSAGGRDCRG